MQNPNRTGNNPGITTDPEKLAGDNTLDEIKENRSEADKEANTRPEDFESFDVDKVDDLKRAKDESDS